MVGFQKVLQVLQAKAQAALIDSSVTDSAGSDNALTDSPVTDSAPGRINTVTARHIGTVQTQLKVALLCS